MTHATIPTGRLLLDAFRAFESRLIDELARGGITDIKASHLNVLRHLDPQGMRLTELARDAVLSKQAASAIVGELVERGYLTFLPDPNDGRAKRVKHTRKGARMNDVATAIVIKLEQEYASLFGESFYQQLRAMLTKLISHKGGAL